MTMRIAYLEEPEPTPERMQVLCDYINFVVGELQDCCNYKQPMPVEVCERLADEGYKACKRYYKGATFRIVGGG